MARLDEIKYENLSAEQQEVYDYLIECDGEITGEFAIWLQIPNLCKCIKKTNVYMQKECGFHPAMLPVIAMVVARKMNCAYMFGLYARRAAKAGVSPDVIDEINQNKHVEFSDPVDQVLFDMAEVLAEHKLISDELFTRCQELLGRDPTTAASTLVGQYLMAAMILNAYDYPVADGDIKMTL